MEGRAPEGRGAWVVSPHLLVAQTVTVALASTGAAVETHAWETLVEGARAADRDAGTRHVIAICDDLDGLEVVEEITRLVAAGDVHVTVVTSPTASVMWGGLGEGGAVDVVTSASSVGGLAVVLERFAAGDPRIDP